ncbi:MAG TPA: polysaccharide biosynthesis tyrosine autokinase, partial [Chitinophagaceae bacterium]|nr:polysaccharide biosynthesis tyrosine autokinase [Chitinophagaceae bacterium]
MSYPTKGYEQEVVQQQASNNQLDAKKLIYKLIGILPWVIISLAISIFAANLYLRYTPKLFRVSGNLLIKDEDQSSYRSLKDLGIIPGNIDVPNQMQILNSYTLTERVIDSLKLRLKLRQEGRVISSELYGKTMPFKINVVEEYPNTKASAYHINLTRENFIISGAEGQKKYTFGDTVDISYGKIILERNPLVKINPNGYQLTINDLESEVRALRSKITVVQLTENGGILEIATNEELPDRGIDIINKLMEVYDNAGLDDKNIVAKKTIQFLNDKLGNIAKDLDSIEIKIEQFRKDNKVPSFSEAGSAFFAEYTGLDKNKKILVTQSAMLDHLESYITNFRNTNDIIPPTFGQTDVILLGLIETHNTTVLAKQKLELISKPTDSHLQNMIESIKGIRQNILRAIRNIRVANQTQLQNYESNYSLLESKLQSIPEKQRIEMRLERDRVVKQEIYKDLLKRKEETELSLASNINNTRIVDYAQNYGPKSPNIATARSVAILFGILIPILIIVIKDFFNTKIQDRKEIEQATAIPILGELSYEKDKKNVVIENKSRSPIAEQFRLIRTNLQYMVPDKPLQSLLVTSFMSGEGKSFVSLNLASSLAITGAKTVILEFDLRKPKLSKYLELSNDIGLSNFIIKDMNIDEIIQEVPNRENLFVISSGPIPPNPAELLLSQRTVKLFEQLATRFDYIIIDTAPVGLVTDALLLEKFVDLSLFILRHKYSFKAEIPFVDKLYRDKKFKNMGIIVNGIKNEGSGYGYG